METGSARIVTPLDSSEGKRFKYESASAPPMRRAITASEANILFRMGRQRTPIGQPN
jgi:hypothetical protein